MQDSRIIEANGIFIGAAVTKRGQQGWQVVAADARVLPAEGQVLPTFQAASDLARRAYWSAESKAA
jgi:hypothetical protein